MLAGKEIFVPLEIDLRQERTIYKRLRKKGLWPALCRPQAFFICKMGVLTKKIDSLVGYTSERVKVNSVSPFSLVTVMSSL